MLAPPRTSHMFNAVSGYYKTPSQCQVMFDDPLPIEAHKML